MRPLGVAIALAGLVAAGVVAVASRDHVVTKEPEVASEAGASEPGIEPAPPPALLPVPPRVRPVAPEIVAVPPVEQDTLERVAAREVLSPLGRAHAPSEGPPRETILHRPVVVGAGHFEARSYRVALAGVEITDAAEHCDSAGISWPCGIHARTAFRNWLRGRALACVVPPVPSEETVVTDCVLGRQNPAEWLVAQGWARAQPDGPYAALEEQAREAARGLFGPAPSAAPLEPLMLPLPEISGG